MNKSEIPAEQKAVLSMLLDDHRKVKKIFKDFESEKDAQKKQSMVTEVCNELTVHTRIEEEKFYPFLREQNEKVFGDMLNEALVEHASAKELISQLRQMTPDDEFYDAKVTVLGEYVNHHVTEEEDEMFTKVISKKVDLRELEEPMKQLKEQAMADEEKGGSAKQKR